MEQPTPQERFQELLRRDRRYQTEAYNFVFEALDFTVRIKYGDESDSEDERPALNQHVTGPDLLEGVRQLALETFGCMTATVFEMWGIKSTEDVGEIVFNLIEYGLMGCQESDSKEDFADGYGGVPMWEVFTVRPILHYNPERDEWKATYKSEVFG